MSATETQARGSSMTGAGNETQARSEAERFADLHNHAVHERDRLVSRRDRSLQAGNLPDALHCSELIARCEGYMEGLADLQHGGVTVLSS